jgi:hypothetical protein
MAVETKESNVSTGRLKDVKVARKYAIRPVRRFLEYRSKAKGDRPKNIFAILI